MELFTPKKVGSIEVANGIVMAPMTRCRAIGNVPNVLMAEYYQQRSSAGLIITEGTSPSPNGLGYARIPGIFSKEQVQGWKLVTTAVHAAGGKINVKSEPGKGTTFSLSFKKVPEAIEVTSILN